MNLAIAANAIAIFELVLNVGIAKTLGHHVPDKLLALADEVT